VSGCVAVVKSTEAEQTSLPIRAVGGRRHIWCNRAVSGSERGQGVSSGPYKN